MVKENTLTWGDADRRDLFAPEERSPTIHNHEALVLGLLVARTAAVARRLRGGLLVDGHDRTVLDQMREALGREDCLAEIRGAGPIDCVAVTLRDVGELMEGRSTEDMVGRLSGLASAITSSLGSPGCSISADLLAN